MFPKWQLQTSKDFNRIHNSTDAPFHVIKKKRSSFDDKELDGVDFYDSLKIWKVNYTAL